jgi:hypothetical protein
MEELAKHSPEALETTPLRGRGGCAGDCGHTSILAQNEEAEGYSSEPNKSTVDGHCGRIEDNEGKLSCIQRIVGLKWAE